jgi:hypothetical protein
MTTPREVGEAEGIHQASRHSALALYQIRFANNSEYNIKVHGKSELYKII